MTKMNDQLELMENNGIKLSIGLFHNPWYRIDLHIKDFWRYIKRVHFVKEHGYPDFAQWETCGWFINIMKPIIKYYRNSRYGDPWVLDIKTENEDIINKYDKQNFEKWNEILDRMYLLLCTMDENDKIYDNMSYESQIKSMNEAKEEFFDLFSKYFYNFWD